jgi:hypothetical protein
VPPLSINVGWTISPYGRGVLVSEQFDAHGSDPQPACAAPGLTRPPGHCRAAPGPAPEGQPPPLPAREPCAVMNRSFAVTLSAPNHVTPEAIVSSSTTISVMFSVHGEVTRVTTHAP